MSRPGSALIACALLALAAGAAQAQPGVPIVNPYRQALRGQQRSGHEGSLRLQVAPKSAEVFVDGYLMGLVDDFDGMFQRLHLDAGEHTLELYRAGYRVGRQKIFVGPRATLRVKYTLVQLGSNEPAEPRPIARQVEARREPPMMGAGPRDPRDDPDRPARPARPGRRGDRPRPSPGADYGTIAVHVQPRDADVLIDGERWDVSPDGRVDVRVSRGRHHVEIRRRGSRPFNQDVEVRADEPTPVNVSLTPEGDR
ncbi:MAG: PEGA domain-containing protein [Vicinamibacterales bacterium]